MVSGTGANVTLTLEVAVLPAMSVACTTMVFAPVARVTLQDRADRVSVAGAPLQVALAMPERASATVPVTVIEEAVTVAPGVGEVIAAAGAVLSILSVTDAVAV
jgi:hypothetical protein